MTTFSLIPADFLPGWTEGPANQRRRQSQTQYVEPTTRLLRFALDQPPQRSGGRLIRAEQILLEKNREAALSPNFGQLDAKHALLGFVEPAASRHWRFLQHFMKETMSRARRIQAQLQDA
ncbi:hypothetical protein ACRAWG_15870 [Methylobacterium sp. P31]